MSKTTDSLTSTCVLCCQGITIYAVGPCNHHICFKCSTKMRVICNQMYCAVCRAEMPKAIFTNKLHPFDGIISHKFPHDRKYGIFFATSRIQEEYRKILANKCQICGIKRQADDTFKKLQDHMRKEHELFSCQLCADHIKVLSSERKFYNRKNLALHRRAGDPDDTSYRGHPLCQFCDERYFDNDELLRHLRKDHYFCHFCEKDGVTNQYYGDYEDLADHFRSDHFLCEEDGCVHEKFLGAFRTDIDLKAHRSKVHSGKMTKIQARQTRQVDVEINLPRREYIRGHREGPRGGGGARGRDRHWREREDRQTARAIEASLESAQREDSDTKRKEKPERKKRDIAKSKISTQDEETVPKEEAARPDSPIEVLIPQKDRRKETKKDSEEDKENEVLTPDIPVPDVSKALSKQDAYSSNIKNKPPDMTDFPTLSEQPGSVFQMGGKWSVAPSQGKDDFPALGNGDGGSDCMPLNVAASFGFYSSLAAGNKTGNDLRVETPYSQASNAAKKEEEFPTLSSIASMLGGSQKKSKTKKKNKPLAKVDSEIDTRTGNGGMKKKNIKTAAESRKDVAIVNDREKIMQTPSGESALPSKKQPTNSLLTLSSSLAPSLPPASRPPPGFKPFAEPSTAPCAPPPGFAAFSPQSTNTGPEFVQPPNFKERNRALVSRIQKMGDEELFTQFRQDSGEFRQDVISAKEYYRRCIQTLSENNFHSIFNELVSLLPDLLKQQELLMVHNDYKAAKAQPRQDSVLKISNVKTSKAGKKTAWKSSKVDSSLCPVCSQVVMPGDMAEHMNVHGDFPALSSSRAKPKPVASTPGGWSAATWGRGK